MESTHLGLGEELAPAADLRGPSLRLAPAAAPAGHCAHQTCEQTLRLVFWSDARGGRQKRLSEERLGDGWALRRPSPSGRRTSRALCPSAACRARAGGRVIGYIRRSSNLAAPGIAVGHQTCTTSNATSIGDRSKFRSDFDRNSDRTSIGLRETIVVQIRWRKGRILRLKAVAG